jgi:predicted O-methyltransferase YrrM
MSSQKYGELKHVPVSPAMRDYLLRSCSPQDPVVDSLVEQSQQAGDLAVMLVPAEQAALLTMLAQLTGARTVLDVGTFTGLSALALARGLAPGGTVTTCDVSDKWLHLARDHWERAGVAGRIDFRLAPAESVLRSLPEGTVLDLAFLDADKENYESYYRHIVPMLRPGGLLIVDNILFNGYVLDPGLTAEGLLRTAATALRAFNAVLAADERLDVVALPIADGLTIARKK